MAVSEQLVREKTRAIVVAIFELVLGAIMIFIALQFFGISDYFRMAIYEMEKSAYTPKYMIDLFRTLLSAILAGGAFAFLHGVKRMVDNTLNAWVKSATPKA